MVVEIGTRQAKPVVLKYLGEQRRHRGRIYEVAVGEHTLLLYAPNVGKPRVWDPDAENERGRKGRELR